MLGAAILAARGALRGGVGLVTAWLPRELMAPFTVAVPPAMTADRARGLDGCAGVDAAVCGPGLTPLEAAECTDRLRAVTDAPLVLDAGALEVETLRTRRFQVATPHPGEAARLLGSSSAAVQADREASVLELVDRFGGTFVLKGARTLVSDGERLFENTTGNSGMATGGTGDVLAGLLGSLLAQGMQPFEAACCAVHVHGAAGDLVASRVSAAGLIATDLPEAIAEVLGR